jgi:hypothetical protein
LNTYRSPEREQEFMTTVPASGDARTVAAGAAAPQPPLDPSTPAGRREARQQRREARRWSPSQWTPCALHALSGESLCSGWVCNMSLLGVGVVVDRPLDPGASVFINLVNAPHTYSLGMVLNVARCVRTYSGDYLIGGKFLRRLTPDELSPFVC